MRAVGSSSNSTLQILSPRLSLCLFAGQPQFHSPFLCICDTECLKCFLWEPKLHQTFYRLNAILPLVLSFLCSWGDTVQCWSQKWVLSTKVKPHRLNCLDPFFIRSHWLFILRFGKFSYQRSAREEELVLNSFLVREWSWFVIFKFCIFSRKWFLAFLRTQINSTLQWCTQSIKCHWKEAKGKTWDHICPHILRSSLKVS